MEYIRKSAFPNPKNGKEWKRQRLSLNKTSAFYSIRQIIDEVRKQLKDGNNGAHIHRYARGHTRHGIRQEASSKYCRVENEICLIAFFR